MFDPETRARLAEIRRAAALTTSAQRAFQRVAPDPERLEKAVDRWIARGRAEFGDAVPLLSLFPLVPLPRVHTGHPAEARLRARVARSEALGPECFRASRSYDGAFDRCPDLDVHVNSRIHTRAFDIAEAEGGSGTLIGAAIAAVESLLRDHGVDPVPDGPILSFAEAAERSWTEYVAGAEEFRDRFNADPEAPARLAGPIAVPPRGV